MKTFTVTFLDLTKPKPQSLETLEIAAQNAEWAKVGLALCLCRAVDVEEKKAA